MNSASQTVLGLIAGSGILPIEFLKEAKLQNYRTIVFAHIGETLTEINQYADQVYWVRLGQFGKIFKLLKKEQVKKLSFAGGIRKTSVFSVRPDFVALSLVLKLKTLNDDVLLRGISAEIEARGIEVIAPTKFLPKLTPSLGLLTRRDLDPNEQVDADLGIEVATKIGSLDIGQTVIVRKKMIVAVEAIEGTDATIARAGQLLANKSKTEGFVMVKLCKPQQDLRFDLPTIGPSTIQNLHQAGGSALIIEANKSILLEPETVVALANKYNMAIKVIESLK